MQCALNDYGIIKCVNFIRAAVAEDTDPRPQLDQGPQVFADERYLQPVLEEDALLCHDFSEVQNQCAVRLLSAAALHALVELSWPRRVVQRFPAA